MGDAFLSANVHNVDKDDTQPPLSCMQILEHKSRSGSDSRLTLFALFVAHIFIFVTLLLLLLLMVFYGWAFQSVSLWSSSLAKEFYLCCSVCSHAHFRFYLRATTFYSEIICCAAIPAPTPTHTQALLAPLWLVAAAASNKIMKIHGNANCVNCICSRADLCVQQFFSRSFFIHAVVISMHGILQLAHFVLYTQYTQT